MSRTYKKNPSSEGKRKNQINRNKSESKLFRKYKNNLNKTLQNEQ